MNYAIIKKYLSGNASEKEVESFFTWIEESPENKSIFIEYKKILALSATNNLDHNAVLWKIQKKISLNNTKKKILNALKYAAIFAGLVFITSITYFQIGTQNKNLIESNQDQITLELEDGSIKVLSQDENFKILGNNGEILGKKELEKLVYGDDDSFTDKDQLIYNTLNVPYGKRFNIELSDGSNVILNAGSKLKYPVNFLKGKSREVYLEGEAFFKVTKNKEDAFIVNTNGLNTQVFGTVFNVSSYKNDQYTNIILI